MRTLSQRMWRSVHSRLSGLYQYFHLVFGTGAYQPSPPSEETVRLGHALFDLLDQLGGESVDASCILSQVQTLLGSSSDVDALPEVLNADGYNVLQEAVLRGQGDFLRLLLVEGVQGGKCSPPLHLACRLGREDLVQLLLAHGADPRAEAGMCHPRPHAPVRHVPSRFHFLETDIYACDGDHRPPLLYAIEGDHLPVVRCLMKDGVGGGWLRLPLHHACRHGARACAQYLCHLRPNELATPDPQQWTPLLHAVQWGRSFVAYLEEQGADVRACTASGQTALHLLFLRICDPAELYETTRFLLGTGLEEDINVVDASGNTALHLLIGLVNRSADSFEVKGLEQEALSQSVLATLELLLSHNCDPNVVNASGITALHRLLLTFDFVMSSDPAGMTLEMLPLREKYHPDPDCVRSAIGVLLAHGADPNAPTGAGRTPLGLLLHSLLDISPALRPGLLGCLQLLCEKGAAPSVTPAAHAAALSTLVALGQRCMQMSMLSDPTPQAEAAAFLRRLLALLLRHGLDANRCSLVRRKDPAPGHLLLELVRMGGRHARLDSDLACLRSWLHTAMKWGANPNLEPYPSEPMICHSQSSIYLKPKCTRPLSQFLHQIQDATALLPGAESILALFYNSMEHETLFSCLNDAKFMSRFDPSSTKTPSHAFLQLMQQLGSQPRSLQQIARVSVCNAMQWELQQRTAHLPLPPPLQRYILNLE